MKKRKKIWTGVLAAVLLIAVAAGMILVPRYRTEPVMVISMNEISYPGYGPGGSESFGQVTTDKVQAVFPSDTQTVTEMKVTQGQQVKAGDVLFTYDTTLSDLALERKDLSVRQMQMELKRAKAELIRLNGLRPMVIPEPTLPPPTESTEPKEDYSISPEKEKLETIYAGEGTAEKPFYYWLSEKEEINDRLVAELLGTKETVWVVFQSVGKDAEKTPFTSQYGVRYTRVTEPMEPTVPETTVPETTEPTVPETTAPETTEPTVPETTVPEITEPTVPEPTEPEITEPSESTGPTESRPAPYRGPFTRPLPEGLRYAMSFFDYTKIAELPEETLPELPEIDFGSGFTQTELVEMRRQQKDLIRELEFNIRMGAAELRIMQKEAASGEVTADFDGVVLSVMEAAEAKLTGQPIVKIAGGGGYYVQGSISELELAKVQIGQSVLISSWDTGLTLEGTIAEIGSYPVEGENGYGSGEQNLSYYPYKVFIDESADLMEGSYVSMSLQAAEELPPQRFLDNAFLRTEGKKSYVYVRGAEGMLQKRYVQTGVSTDGYATPILSGLDETDYIAFPYGKDVREGAATVEGSMQDLYQNS